MYSKLGFTKNAEIIASKIEITKTISFFTKAKSWEKMIFDFEVWWIESIIKKTVPAGIEPAFQPWEGRELNRYSMGPKSIQKNLKMKQKKLNRKDVQP